MNKTVMENHLREKIIANPDVLLEDHDVMRALVGANDDKLGENIVDLRAIAMARLEARFDRLEDTHRNVIAAAYDNLAGTNQVHRAILRMMDATAFDTFLHDLTGDVANTLRVDAIRLVLESPTPQTDTTMGPVVAVVPQGFVDDYITLGRNMPARQITLRPFQNAGASLYGDRAGFIHSEACLKLDLGAGHLPGMLVMGSEDPQQFSPQQGTDLLTFFTGVFERVMRRWLP
ncbi:DUF484 family protein [Yoonia sp.]|jgi:uncharacterized protein YigA (DUF484 family)|uniref:DUF484 family protein n=1 Tax=Yoonia sp. TaxID=2212373 RepID=UPI0025FA518D|nr:DUF484 family protein [Yoonia sp.]